MTDEAKERNQAVIDVLTEEYKIASNSREGYMRAYTQTNFYFGVIAATFGLGIWKFEWCFVMVPFMIMIQYSIVQWNQYHSFLAEVFLAELERKINANVKKVTGINPNLDYFSFYNVLFRQNMLIKDTKTRVPLIKPTALLAATLGVTNMVILAYSIWRSCRLLSRLPAGKLFILFFLVVVSILMTGIIYNFARMPKNMKRILRNVLIESCGEGP